MTARQRDAVAETQAQREQLMEDLERRIEETRAMIEKSRTMVARVTDELASIEPVKKR